MKRLFLIPILVLVAAFSINVCRKSEPKLDVSKLEELPKEIADNLKRIPHSDVLVSIAPIATREPPPGKPIFTRACSETQDYWVQVGYPVTICNRPDLVDSTFMAPAPPRSSEHSVTTIVTSYKLSAFEGTTLTTPYRCQSRRGPWLAKITKRIECNNATSCSMVILGVPSCPSCPTFLWGGESCEVTNRPAEVQFDDPPVAQGPPRLSACNNKTNCDGTPTPPTPIF